MKPSRVSTKALGILCLGTIVAVMFTMAGPLASSPWVTLKSGPGLFVDSLWGYSIYVPEHYLLEHNPKDSLLANGYDATVRFQSNPDKAIGLYVLSFNKFCQSLNPGECPTFSAAPDSLRSMAEFLIKSNSGYVSQHSDVVLRTDSITEERTKSGLRIFAQHATQQVAYKDNPGGNSTTLPVTYFVAVPRAGDWTFVCLYFGVDDPSPGLLTVQRSLARSVAAWKK
jgi:hypothetical protein